MSSRGTIRVGASGWAYPSWRGDFFPAGLVQRAELSYLAERMTSVEINGSFYSLQRPASYERWRDSTPEDFLFAVKGGRYITHMKRLRDIEVPLANFFASGVLALREKLGPVLWQLPASLGFDEKVLSGFLDLLPRTTTAAAALARRHDDKVPEDYAMTSAARGPRIRHALEVRHESFCSEPALRLLRKHDVAMVLADSAGRWPVVDEATSDLAYVRLHGHTTLYASGYSGRSLDRWADRCLAWQQDGRDVVVYFDNDMRGRAPHDAVALLDRLGSAARTVVTDSRRNERGLPG